MEETEEKEETEERVAAEDGPEAAEAGLERPPVERRDARPRIRGWRLVALSLSILSILAGVGLGLASWGAAEEPGGHGAAPAGAAGLVAGSEEGPGMQQAPPPSADLSPVFLKLGFSFFVGFAVGYALRLFLKLSALFAGLFFLAVFGLSHAGILEVHWEAFGALFDSFTDRVQDDFSSLIAFFGGSLPSAGLLGLGLYAGLKKA